MIQKRELIIRPIGMMNLDNVEEACEKFLNSYEVDAEPKDIKPAIRELINSLMVIRETTGYKTKLCPVFPLESENGQDG